MRIFISTIILLLFISFGFGQWTGNKPIKGSLGKNIVQDADGNLVFLNHTEKEIHDGTYYYIEGYTTLASDGDSFMVKLVTPDTDIHLHFSWDITSNGVLTSELWEGSSGGMTGGSGVTPLNSNRNSDNTSAVVITSGVSVATSQGTRIANKKVGGTAFKSTTGGSDASRNEVLLKRNTTYQRIFITGSDANIVSFRAMWIEE